MPRYLWRSLAILLLVLSAGWVLAQRFPPGRRPPRDHRVTQSRELRLVPATEQPRYRKQVAIKIEGEHRVIRANGVPAHRTGPFPNRGNPHSIATQSYQYRVPVNPKKADLITPLRMQNFGIAVNGIPFDPGAAEWYRGDRQGGWQYEPLSGAVPLGLDANHAHVQPTGAYHYHGLPANLLAELGVKASSHSPIVGWAADGFPIYAIYGYSKATDKDSKVRSLKSSYRLKKGDRPGGPRAPGDGTFVADYVFEEGRGDLDECNGRFGLTPDYPDGTYAYFLTKEWPVIPRNYRGTPSEDFRRRRGPPRKR